MPLDIPDENSGQIEEIADQGIHFPGGGFNPVGVTPAGIVELMIEVVS